MIPSWGLVSHLGQSRNWEPKISAMSAYPRHFTLWDFGDELTHQIAGRSEQF